MPHEKYILLDPTGQIFKNYLEEKILPIAISSYVDALKKFKSLGCIINVGKRLGLFEDLCRAVLEDRVPAICVLSDKLMTTIERDLDLTFHTDVHPELRLMYALSSLGACVADIKRLLNEDNKNRCYVSPSDVLKALNILYKAELISGTSSNIIYPYTLLLSQKLSSLLLKYMKGKQFYDDVESSITKTPIPGPQIENPVKEFNVLPTFSEFHSILSSEAYPIKIRGAASHWPALGTRSWTNISYLIQSIGPLRLVPVELGFKYTDENWTQRLMPFKEFVDRYLLLITEEVKEKGYLAQYDLFSYVPQLMDDIIIPDYCCIPFPDDETSDEVKKSIINIWLGPEGTVSPLHTDPYHNFFVQVFGYKYLRFYPNSQSEKLYAYGDDDLLHNTSKIDVENIEHASYPLLNGAKCTECIMGPGDMCFIPKNCWHFVKSLTVSCSVSIWIK